ncbi:hypothetical protein Vretifemale_9201, partial [Volvox reticuliferus]
LQVHGFVFCSQLLHHLAKFGNISASYYKTKLFVQAGESPVVQAMADLLFNVRNSFYLGAYNTVINEAADLDLSEADAIERDCFVYRSYIALGSYDLVISEIRDSAATGLLAVKLQAQYLSGRKSKEDVLATLQDWLSDSACNRNTTVLLVAGMIHAQEGNYPEALKCCHGNTNLEMQALCVQVYLKMDRPDKAEQQVKTMSGIDDDATLTQLATAWVGQALVSGSCGCASQGGEVGVELKLLISNGNKEEGEE